ncbi:hypothetical protein tb265_44760 [Gemmatimonadetes bacterium T265]|nr:hypothetical protein tb265_44760 [Gemmatimonadetes bacterium T265]
MLSFGVRPAPPPPRPSAPVSQPTPDHTPDAAPRTARAPASHPEPAPSVELAAVTPPTRRVADGGGRGGRPRAADRMLQLLLLAAERDVRVGLTVAAGNVVVTGALVGTVAYCRAVADQFTTIAGGTGMDETFADAFRSLVDEAYGVAQGDRRYPADATAYEQAVGFVHLADARYLTGSGLLPAGRHGVLWCCRVDDVTSWSLADLTRGA